MRSALRVIPGGVASPTRPASSQPSPIFMRPGVGPGFYPAFALALVPCLAFWTTLAFGVYALVH